ncbi:MAG TPA: hypothetical protein VE732_07155, partial [Nitrososphaera sp.]|nr:hypothetical protein [Nitrososphaera sp.]
MPSPLYRLFYVARASRAEPIWKVSLNARLILAALICTQAVSLPLLAQGSQTGATHTAPILMFFKGGAPSPNAPEPPTNQSTLTVFVGVRDGRLVVDRAKSAGGFAPTDEFVRRLGMGLSAARVDRTLAKFRETLFDDLD